MKKLIMFSLASIWIYGMCSFIVWNQNVTLWPWWMRGIYVCWILMALLKIIDDKR
jgi:hypothetical protein